MDSRHAFGYAVAAFYVVVVVLANVLSSRFGLVPIGFGLVASAGTYCAGAALISRDLVQRQVGKAWSLAVIPVGAMVSFLLADPHIALASLLAFAISECVDFGIYTPLRRRGFAVAATVSSLLAGLIDTLVFLRVAGFPLGGEAIAGQMVGKGYAVLIVAVFVVAQQLRTREVVAG